MRASVAWLRELSELDLSAEEMAEKLTSLGIEVEAVERFGDLHRNVVVAEVRSKKPHPKRPEQTLVTVADGDGTHEIVCGASNVPEPGGRVVLARIGATLPGGLTIAERAIAGVTSRGMLASEAELGIGGDADGILVLGPSEHARVGEPIAEALRLRDEALVLSLTPNRPDCLGHVGLARELCALQGQPFAPPPVRSMTIAPLMREIEGAMAEDVDGVRPSVRVEAVDRCPRYGASVVTGVEIRPSPLSVRARLHVLGVRALSNVVDATNLVLYGWGYPTHAFDLDRLEGMRIVVRRARPDETMATLDGVERKLTSDDLMICDAEKPVAVAGVMGGATSEIHDGTTRVLIECAYFDPRSVRRTSRRLGLHTDASHRFERGVDPGAVPAVLADVTGRIAATTPDATVLPAIDVCPAPPKRARISLRVERASKLIGVDVTEAEAKSRLALLGCDLLPVTDAIADAVLRQTGSVVLDVDAPTWRPDLVREVDLIEELMRFHGYDRLASEPPPVRPSAEGTSAEIRFVRRVREAAAAAGLNEAVNYAFLSPRELSDARVETHAVVLANPLGEERSVLRTSLLPGLLGDVRRAQRHGEHRVALFELANVFSPDDGSETGVKEQRILALMLAGPRASWPGEDGEVDFWDAKGALESVLRTLVALPVETVVDDALADAPYLHPRRSALVKVGGVPIGVVGEVHPDVVAAFDLVGRPVYAGVGLAKLLEAHERGGLPRSRPLPRFPAVTRDLAVVVAEDVHASRVAEVVRGLGVAILEDVQPFDVYRGEHIPAGHKSMAFRIVYRDPDATLVDATVEKVHADVVKAVSEKLGAELRK